MIDHLFIPLLGLFLIALMLGYSTGYLPSWNRLRWLYERRRQYRADLRFFKQLDRLIEKQIEEGRNVSK